ncbi:MAG: FkbM family methyltransferase [Armatimonadota bacterium]
MPRLRTSLPGRLPTAVSGAAARIIGSARVRIKSGPNAGLKWSVVSAGRGYASGTFEAQRLTAIIGLLRQGDRFWDIGAHKGYVSLAAARKLGPEGQVFAFEPADSNLIFLRLHVVWNCFNNIRIIPVAVSSTDGIAQFGGSGSSIAYRIGHGTGVARTRTIRALVEQDSLPLPTVLKIDAEGSEAEILRDGLSCLPGDVLIWVSLHSRELYEECRSLLQSRGYTLVESKSLKSCASEKNGSWKSDPELLAVGPERDLTDAELRLLEQSFT